jgi:hypothetical protein
MRSLLRSLVVLMALSYPTLASAEIRNFAISEDGKSCSPGAIIPDQDIQGVRFSVVDSGERLSTWTLQFFRTDGQQTMATLIGATRSTTILIDNASRQPGSKVTLAGRVAGADVTCLKDEEISPAGVDATELDSRAELWLSTDVAKTKLAAIKRNAGASVVLLHLPSGRVASTNPASLREDAVVLVAMVIDTNHPSWAADVNVLSCPERDPNRILGNFEGVSLHAAVPQFDLLAANRPFQCGSGLMQYAFRASRDRVAGTEQRTSWRVRPVYRFSATVTLGYDTGQDRSYGVKDGKIALTPNPTTVGFKNKLGFTWFPFGVDYENMRLINYLVNPVVLFDLDTPKKAFVIGNSFTPSGGVSVTLGASFRKVAVPKDGKAGDATTETSVATQEDWAPEGRSLYVGLSFDTKIFSSLKGLMPKAEAKE